MALSLSLVPEPQGTLVDDKRARRPPPDSLVRAAPQVDNHVLHKEEKTNHSRSENEYSQFVKLRIFLQMVNIQGSQNFQQKLTNKHGTDIIFSLPCASLSGMRSGLRSSDAGDGLLKVLTVSLGEVSDTWEPRP